MFNLIFRLLRLIFSLPFIFLVLAVAVLVFTQSLSKSTDSNKNQNEEQDQTPHESRDVEPATLVYEESPAYEGAHYFEKYEQIDGQWAYIAYPLSIDPKIPPRLIIYSHGSITFITNDREDPFMKDMQEYGEFFTKEGFSFAASNQHGANWGNDAAIQDMVNLRDWIKERYRIQDKLNLVAHSMGGLPTLHFAFKYPEVVNKVALLSPTTYVWGKTEYDSLKEIPVRVWHGDRDINISWNVSKGFVDRGTNFGKKIDLITIQGGDHWAVDTELKDEILSFYNE